MPRYDVVTIGAIGDPSLTLPGLKDLPPLGIPSDWLPPGVKPPPGVPIIPVPGAPKPDAAEPARLAVPVVVAIGAGALLAGALASYLIFRRS